MIRRSLFGTALRRRLAPLIGASFVGSIALWVPVEKLFLTELGFTPQTIGLMAAIYAAVGGGFSGFIRFGPLKAGISNRLHCPGCPGPRTIGHAALARMEWLV